MSNDTAMKSEIGPLLEEINKKGVQEAKAQKEEIISKAGQEAEKIISDARKEAEAIKAKAADDAAKTRAIVEADLKQASKSVQQICKNSINDIFTNAFSSLARQTFETDTAVIAEVINIIAKAMAQGKEIEVEIDTAVNEQKVKAAVLAVVKKEVSAGVEIKIAPGMSGVSVSKKGEQISYEVTPALVTEAMYKMLSRISKDVLGSKK
jgi:V/A-type H+-transporting ATPase subunit E